jgi:DNA-binding GntR family transcriptional regulator
MAADVPLSYYRTKTEIILDQLRQRINSGELVPGQRLVLRVVREEFACSDIPVREAMRALAAEGLVVLAPHEGARVADLRTDELVELTETRALLEPAATVAAGERIAPAEVEALARLADTMRAVSDGREAGDYGRLNRTFHRTLLAACPNRTLAELIEDLWSRAERGRAVHRFLEGHRDTSMQQHDEIVRCLRERDLAGLRAVAEAHSQHGLAAVKRLAAEETPAAAADPNRRTAKARHA